MLSKKTNKEKLQATATVVILLLIVAIVLGYTTFSNKQDTLRLQSQASNRKLEIAAIDKVSKLEISNFNFENITAKSVLTLAVTSGNYQKVLLQKNSDQPFPIASLTKLMTAVIVREKISLRKEVVATADYVGGYGSANVLEVGKTYTVLELLKNILISSDNDSARLLSSFIGEEKFINLMNSKARDLNLTQTKFTNVTGLDSLIEGQSDNVSSANDIAKLMLYIDDKHPDLFQITRDTQYNFCDIDQSCYTIHSTNLFLNNPNFKFKIIGGKTGYTFSAGKNLALILQPFDGIFLINIVLGSQDNFADTKVITNHLTLKN